MKSSSVGKGVTVMEGGSLLLHLGSLWNSSSETYGMKGEIILNPVSRHVYSTVLAVKIAPEIVFRVYYDQNKKFQE